MRTRLVVAAMVVWAGLALLAAAFVVSPGAATALDRSTDPTTGTTAPETTPASTRATNAPATSVTAPSTPAADSPAITVTAPAPRTRPAVGPIVPAAVPTTAAPIATTIAPTTTLAGIGDQLTPGAVTVPLQTKGSNGHVDPVFAWLSAIGFAMVLLIVVIRLIITRAGGRDRAPLA